MGVFLDARTSLNSNRTGSPGTPLSSAPELFGIIGLQTKNIPNPIVILHGTIGILGDIGDVVTIEIVRGATYAPQNVIHTIEDVVSESSATHLTTFVTADINAPGAPETIYSSYVSGISTSIRNGPESFVGIASTS
ncbi:hypothetical protein YSY43_01770 [Paenibacillus sp. YSY-4.3]